MNQAPTLTALQQLDLSMMSLDAGVSLFNAPRLRASIDDPENDSVHLDLEVVASTASFTNTPSTSSALEPEGSVEVLLSTLPAGTYKWQARARDAAGATSAWQPYASGADAFTILPNPVTGSVAIAAGAAAINTNTVTLTLAASSGAGAITTMAFSNDGTTFTAPEPYATSRAGWALAAMDGTRTVAVRFFDALGNSAIATDSIVVDTVPPQLTNFAIDANATATASGSVTLTWTASDPGSGIAAQHASNDGSTFTVVTAAPATWSLTAGDGLKNVTLRLTDGAGNLVTASQNITRDSTPPTLMTVVLNGGAAFTSSTSAQLTLVATDTSGVAQVCVQGAVATPGCVPFGAGGPYALTLTSTDGAKTVNVTVVDTVGNVSSVLSDSITLDATPPLLTSLTLASGADFTRTLSVATSLVGASDANLTQMEFSLNGGTTWSAPVAYAAVSTVTLVTPDGLKTVQARVIDAAGNRSPARSDDVTLDTTVPTLTLSAPRGTNQTTALVTLTPSMDASGITAMCLKVTAVATAVVPPTGPTDPCFTAFASSASVTVSTGGAGDKRVHGWVRDGATNISVTATTDVFYDLTAPTAPTGLTATASNHGFILSWVASSDVSGSGVATYEAGLSKTSGGPYVFQTVGTGTSGFLEASNDVTWFIVLRARDVAGNVSVVSTQVSGTPYFPWQYQQREPTSADLVDLESLDAGTTTRFVAVGASGVVLSSDDGLVTWTRRDALTEGSLAGVAKAGGALYVSGAQGMLARSDDLGVSFFSEVLPTQLAASTVADVAVVGTGTGTVTLAAVSSSGDIARQVVTGTTRAAWTHVGRPTTNALRGVARCSGASAGTACAGANSGVSIAVGAAGTILRSNDSGATWAVVPLGSFAVDYAARTFSSVAHRPSSNEFFITVSNATTTISGLLVYDAQSNLLSSAGASWNGPKLQVKVSDDGLTGIVLSSSTPQFVLRFSPGSVGSPTQVSGMGAHSALAAASTTVVGLVGAAGQVSVANASTFVNQTAGVSTTLNAIVTQAGVTANAWAVGSPGIVATTTDTGATWSLVSVGTTVSLRGVSMVNTSGNTPYVVAVGASTTIVRKRGANAWGVQPTTALGTLNTLIDVSCIAPATTSNTVRCIAAGTNGQVVSLTQDVSVGDGTWVTEMTEGNTSVEHRAVTHIHVSGTNFRTIIAGVGGRMVRWTGSAWTPLEVIVGGPTINDLATRHGTGTQTMACGNAGAIRFTTDYGATWTSHNPVGFGAENFNACANLPGTADWLVVGTNGTMLKATWTGTDFTWQSLARMTTQSLTSAATASGNTDRAYVSGGGGTVLFTATGGD